MKKEFIVFYLLFNSLFLTAQLAVKEIGELPNAVFETSGMIFHDGKLLTHNDSGNTAQLFEIDTVSLQITRTVTLTNAENIDWEDIAQDEEYIYIGDFGNNRGIRQNLAVYRIAKADYDLSNSVTAERIDFAYEDQFDFMNTGTSDWDAEALIVLEDQLIVFTKQLRSTGTSAYSLPKTPGAYTATRLDSYAIPGFVSGATYNPLTEKLSIVGYDKVLRPFLLQVDSVTENAIFNETATLTYPDMGLAQVESVAYVDANTYYLSSEFFEEDNPPIKLSPKLFSYKIGDTSTPEEPEEEPQEEIQEEEIEEEINGDEEPINPVTDPNLDQVNVEQFSLYKTFGSDRLHYNFELEGEIYGAAIFSPSGHLIYNLSTSELLNDELDVSIIAPGIYYFTVFSSKGLTSKAFILE